MSFYGRDHLKRRRLTVTLKFVSTRSVLFAPESSVTCGGGDTNDISQRPTEVGAVGDAKNMKIKDRPFADNSSLIPFTTRSKEIKKGLKKKKNRREKKKNRRGGGSKIILLCFR